MPQRPPVAFLSYATINDTHDQGNLTELCARLSAEVRVQTGEDFPIFQDRTHIQWGQAWEDRLSESLNDVTFLIPIITPSFFKSKWCREELERFVAQEKALGRSDLILPVYYVDCPALKNEANRDQDSLAAVIAARQMADWRDLRFEPWSNPAVGKALAKMAVQIRDTLERLQASTPHGASPSPAIPALTTGAKVFVSYKRDVTPDEPVALEIVKALSRNHSVFIDQTMLVGTPWAERIKTEIQQSDALIVLLSESSVQSEMVLSEVAMAHEFSRSNGERPTILPVRLAYREPFEYPLNFYLDPINWAFWSGPESTSKLIQDLEQALAGNGLPMATPSAKTELVRAMPKAMPRPAPSAQPRPAKPRPLRPLELPEGTMMPDSTFYVERSFDRVALDTIQQQGVTITIKGPRQMGKSSLLSRVMDAATQRGKQVAFLDFQLFDKLALANADDFFPGFCAWLTDELDVEDRVDEYWQNRLSNTQRCTRYVERYLLQELGQPIVLAMDEVECTFDTDFRSDFFSMLRSWHNKRATKAIWKQLDLALVTSTEPYQLIENLNQSPFNVGQVIELTDFGLDQINDLNARHGSPLTAADQQGLMNLVHGHPYLVRKALYLVASGQLTADELFNQAYNERGPFGDHLRYHLFRIYDQPELKACFLRVVQSQTCPDEKLFFRPRGAGLVRRRNNGDVVPRCELYARYFEQHLR